MKWGLAFGIPLAATILYCSVFEGYLRGRIDEYKAEDLALTNYTLIIGEAGAGKKK